MRGRDAEALWDPNDPSDARDQAAIEALVGARPEDPSAADAEAAAVRILARVAVRASAEGARPKAARWQRRMAWLGLGAAAAVLVGVGVLALREPAPVDRPHQPAAPDPQPTVAEVAPAPTNDGGHELPTAPGEAASPHEARVAPLPEDPERALRLRLEEALPRALAGDARARGELRRESRRAAHVILDDVVARLPQDPSGAQQGLALLRQVAGRPTDEVLARVAELGIQPALTADVARWLGTRGGQEGIRLLGTLLAEPRVAEAPLLEVLATLGRRGQRRAAYGALLAGVRAGRIDSICLALDLGGASRLERTLAVAPDLALRSPTVVDALADAPAGIATRLRALAVGEHPGALALAAAARLPAVVPQLRVRALGPAPREAAEAVRALARYSSSEAFLALGDAAVEATSDEARLQARAALRKLPREGIDRLVTRARMSTRQTASIARTLVESGPLGMHAARQLVQWRGRAREVVAAFGEASSSRACVHLQDIALFESSVRRYATRMLCVRHAAGDEAAPPVLVALARRGQASLVFAALLELGPEGRPVLERLREDAALRPRATRALERLDEADRHARRLDAAAPERGVAPRPRPAESPPARSAPRRDL